MKAIYTLVGMRFRETIDYVKTLPAGKPLTLRREPDNRYDRNAVRVLDGELLIGYVKATQARNLAFAMDRAGKAEIAGTLSVTPDRWPMIEVDE